jgi:GNAT superfamily N-acetyltransferase
MDISIERVTLPDIISLRAQFLRENHFQVRYHARHERQWCDEYIIIVDGIAIGYGSVKGKDDLKNRDSVFEFYVLPSHKAFAHLLFAKLLSLSTASWIETQSNTLLLAHMLYQFSDHITADVILFNEGVDTHLESPAHFRKRADSDVVFDHTLEPVGKYVLDIQGEIVATGGFMTYYNPPFVDLYMEVKASHQQKGLGSFLIQELKKECFALGFIPAARCSIENFKSRKTLLKAGMNICAYMLSGPVKKDFMADGI